MSRIKKWSDQLASSSCDALLSHHEHVESFIELARAKCKKGKKICFIGNGGSASIASHMAEDYTKNGKLRSIAFNDAALLTCLANDYGYENVFKEAIKAYCDKEDILVAISSSGKSQNIINACKQAKEKDMSVVTLSGFDIGNPLYKMGRLNFWVDAQEYGLVEIIHLAILHCALDIHCEGK